MAMTIDEAINHLGNYSSTNGSGLTTDKQHNEAKRVAIDTMRKYQKIFDKYEILTASFEDSDSPEVRSNKVDEFCIDTMRGLLGEYYADKVKQELKDANN